MNLGQQRMMGPDMDRDISLQVAPVGQITSCTRSKDGRIYRCRTCEDRSPLVHDGRELREWFLDHSCGE